MLSIRPSQHVRICRDGTETAAEFAAKIFEYWCIEGDKFNGYLSGVRLVIEFLAELDYEMTEQQLVDLRSITQSSPLTSAQVESWVRVVTQ